MHRNPAGFAQSVLVPSVGPGDGMKLATLVVLLLWPALAFGGVSGSLEGVVTDATTAEPIAGASIVVVETRQGTVSDTLGHYRLHNIRAGTYQVQVSMLGYRAVATSGVLVLPDRRAELDVPLPVSPIQMQSMEVILQRPLIETDITGTAYRMDAGGLTGLPVDSFQDVIGLQPSTTVEGHIRGGKVRETIYLVDGLPVQDVIQGGAGAELPLSAISQMTIQTGGFDAEYGDALSGVVNVISHTGGDTHELSLRLAKDDIFGGEEVNHRNEMEVAASGPLGSPNLSYFSASNALWTDTPWWQDMQHFFDSPVRKEFNGLTKVDFNSPKRGRLTAELIYSMARWHDYEFSWRYNLDGLPARLRDSYRAALLWTRALTQHTAVSVSLSRFSLHSRIGAGGAVAIDTSPYDYDFYLLYVTSGSRSWWADQQQHTYTLKTDVTHEFRQRHILKTGLELKQYEVDPNLWTAGQRS